MGREISRFGQDTYVLAEGYEDELGRKLCGQNGLEYEADDHIAESVLKPWPRLRFAERFEWFDIFPSSETEAKILLAMSEAQAEGRAMDITEAIEKALPGQEAKKVLRNFFDGTWMSMEEVAWTKEYSIKTTMELAGVPEDVARLHVEKTTTFRSLMAARDGPRYLPLETVPAAVSGPFFFCASFSFPWINIVN